MYFSTNMEPMRKALFAAGMAALASATACERTEKPPMQITAQEAYGLLSNDFAVLTDVREPAELGSGMAAPARWLAMSKIEANDAEWKRMMDGISKDKQVVFYGLKGGRAARAAEKAAKLGFRAASFDAFEEWKRAGLPVKRP